MLFFPNIAADYCTSYSAAPSETHLTGSSAVAPAALTVGSSVSLPAIAALIPPSPFPRYSFFLSLSLLLLSLSLLLLSLVLLLRSPSLFS